MKTAILLVAALLSGCNEDQQQADQCMRTKLFESCMRSLPAGPVSTQYNDWAEGIDECESAAYYQSIRRESQIKLECRP